MNANGVHVGLSRPARPTLILENIPAEIRSLTTGCVVWRYTLRPDGSKWDKPPLRPSDMRPASLPGETGSFQQAIEACANPLNDLDGPGLCPAGLPYVLIDLDGCLIRVWDEDAGTEIEVVLQ